MTSMLLRITGHPTYNKYKVFISFPTKNRELMQTRRRRGRKRERHLKMWLRVSAIIFQLFKLVLLEKCVLTTLELNCNKRLGHEKTKLNICHHTLTSSTHSQNSSFHVVERTGTSTNCQKMKNARAKRAKILFFIVKYANLWGFCCRRSRGCLSSRIKTSAPPFHLPSPTTSLIKDVEVTRFLPFFWLRVRKRGFTVLFCSVWY